MKYKSCGNILQLSGFIVDPILKVHIAFWFCTSERCFFGIPDTKGFRLLLKSSGGKLKIQKPRQKPRT